MKQWYVLYILFMSFQNCYLTFYQALCYLYYCVYRAQYTLIWNITELTLTDLIQVFSVFLPNIFRDCLSCYFYNK